MAITIVNKTPYYNDGLADTFTIPSTTAGNVLIAVAYSFMTSLSATTPCHWNSPTFVTSDVDGVFTQIPYYSLPGQSGTPWDWGFIPHSGCVVDILYVATAGGATVISFDSTAPNGVFMELYEVSGLYVTPVAVDDFQITGSSSSVAVVGAALAGSQSNDFCLQNISSWNGNITAIDSPWTLESDWFGDGPAYIVGGSGTQSAPNMTDSHGTDIYTCISAAFGDSAASTSPHITALNPSCGNIGDSVTITGTNFGASQGGSTVTFNGTTASVTSWSATSIVVTVPGGATTGPVIVTVGSASNSVTFTIPPPAVTVTGVSPSSFTWGLHSTLVTVTGTGFGSTQGSSVITFGGVDLSADVTSWSTTSIQVNVPPSINSGQVVVTVVSGNCSVSSAGGTQSSLTVNDPPPQCTTDAARVWFDSLNFGTGIVNIFTFMPSSPGTSYSLGRAVGAADRITCGRAGHYLIGGNFTEQHNGGHRSDTTAYELWLNGSAVASDIGGNDSTLEVDLVPGDYIQINVTASNNDLNAQAANLWMVQLPSALSVLTGNPSLYETFSTAQVTPNFTTVYGFGNLCGVIPLHLGGSPITTMIPNSGTGAGQQDGGLYFPPGHNDDIYLLTGVFAGVAGAAVLCDVVPQISDGTTAAPVGGIGISTATNSYLAQTPLPVCNFSNVFKTEANPPTLPAPTLAFRSFQDTSGGLGGPPSSATVQVSNFQATKIFPFCGCGGNVPLGDPYIS